MSSLTTEDATAYREFLANPQPADRWVSRRGAIRLSPAWRPFRGPLSGRSVAYAVTVLTALFDWLVHQHYLVRNIWRGLTRQRTINAAAEANPDQLVPETGRWLTPAQWGVMRSVLDALGTHEEHQRMRLVCLLAYTTGMRLSELASARIGHLDALVDEGDGIGESGGSADNSPGKSGAFTRRVVLRVRGKGNKIRTVPIIPQVNDHLNAYLATRGLPSWVECQDLAAQNKESFGWLRGTPVFAKLRGARRRRTLEIAETATAPTPTSTYRHDNPIDPRQETLSTKRIYQVVRSAFESGEALLRKRGYARDAEVFARASTHWLRHTFGRHAVSGGVKINLVQTLLGHASLQTTTIYTSDDRIEAWDAVRAFTMKRL
ncbi:MAG: tyrosine-type recombinase/integrase, partial [Planctomycetales bacterium]|nr:tyrosine-type recombinase/integrase [Planctomycetales bacterium]